MEINNSYNNQLYRIEELQLSNVELQSIKQNDTQILKNCYEMKKNFQKSLRSNNEMYNINIIKRDVQRQEIESEPDLLINNVKSNTQIKL